MSLPPPLSHARQSFLHCSNYGVLALLGFGLVVGGCQSRSDDPSPQKFPKLSDIPAREHQGSALEERIKIIQDLERARRGEDVHTGQDEPAVPDDAQSATGWHGRAMAAMRQMWHIKSSDQSFVPAAQSRPVHASLDPENSSVSLPELRGAIGSDGAERPLGATGITGSVDRASGSALILAFDGDSADLRTADRERAINLVLSHLARGGQQATVVAGGGAPDLAQQPLGSFSLGLERASAVADLLVQVGMKPAAIEVAVAGDRGAADRVAAPYLEIAEDGAVLILR